MELELNFKELRAAVNDLNQSKLIKESIPLVGVEKEEIFNLFMKEFADIPDDPKTGEFPIGADIALDYYNKMGDLEKKLKDKNIKETKMNNKNGKTNGNGKATEKKTDKKETKVTEKKVNGKVTEKKADKKVVKTEKKAKGEKSRKLVLYEAWKKKPTISYEDLEKIGNGVQLGTIKAWVGGWRNGKRLPSGI